MAKDSVVIEKSFKFSVRIVKLYQFLCKEKREYELSRQILKSGTSIGANIEEAHAGISRSDFSNKISISYKEAKETKYWLRLLYAANYINKKMFNSMLKDCDEICRICFSILKTTRINKTTNKK